MSKHWLSEGYKSDCHSESGKKDNKVAREAQCLKVPSPGLILSTQQLSLFVPLKIMIILIATPRKSNWRAYSTKINPASWTLPTVMLPPQPTRESKAGSLLLFNLFCASMWILYVGFFFLFCVGCRWNLTEIALNLLISFGETVIWY